MRWLLKGKPYAVQSEATKQANGRRGFAFFMEMGLGKTTTAYNEFLNLLEMDLVDVMIVLCPQSLKSDWALQAEEWGVGIPVQSWPKVKGDPKILTINWEAMIGKGGEYIEKILKSKRVYFALDESIHAKNPQAKRTKRIIGLCVLAEYVRVLSGAPMVKSPLDLWGQFRCIGELKGFNPFAFRNRFCVMGGYMGKQIVGARNNEELSEMIDMFSFRALKKDWTDLPEQLFNERNYELKGEQLELYNEMLNDLMIKVNDETITAPMVITQMMKLQQISSGFIIDEEGTRHQLVERKDNPKLKLLKEIIDEMDTKVLVFAFYRQTVDMLIEELGATFIRGGMSDEEREEQKYEFNNGDTQSGVMQLTAGKYGHTMLGSSTMPCHTSIYFENVYDLDARVQSEARNHRHGQHYPVTYLDLIGTPEDRKIVKALQRKLNLASAIVDAIRSK